MYRTGSPSWRFEHDNLHILHRALFVRDAAMLPVTALPEVPPRLIDDVPAIPAVVPEADRAAANRSSGAAATHAAYQAWSAAPGRTSAPEHEFFPWQLVHDAAHDAAASLGRPVSDMDAVAHVLAVESRWSYLAGAECGVCSVAVARDSAAAGELVRKLFVSGYPAAA